MTVHENHSQPHQHPPNPTSSRGPSARTNMLFYFAESLMSQELKISPLASLSVLLIHLTEAAGPALMLASSQV